MRSFLQLAIQEELQIAKAVEVDRSPEGVQGRQWDKTYLSAAFQAEDDGTEMDRRRWLLVAELRWNMRDVAADWT